MDRESIESGLRANWYLVVLLGVVILATLVAVLLPEKAEAPAEGAGAAPAVSVSPEKAAELAIAASPYQPASEDDETQGFIEKYRKAIADDPESEDTPLNMRRIGNLYASKLRDYGKAAEQYEALIYRFPEWEGLDKVYPNLASCYHKLGDVDKEMWTYERVMEKFPKDSQLYLLAKGKLGY